MLKWRIVIVLALIVGISIALTAQAQQAQPITQPTVDAAVATLIAQTQNSPQMQATQTIGAALGQALTATAVANTSASTPSPMMTSTDAPTAIGPVNAASLKVTGTTDVDVIAGPTTTGAYLSPDGTQFAYLTSAVGPICLYQGSTQGKCFDLGGQVRGIDTESLRWSPDGRYIAFTEEFFRTLRDADIWVLDTQSGKVTDLTDDGVTSINFTQDNWNDVDVFPRWTDKDTIIFLRYSRVKGQIQPPEIIEVAPDGSGATTLGTVSDFNDPFAIYALDVQGDQLIYGYTSQSGSVSDGVWISDFSGKNARQLNHIDHSQQILEAVELSPDGKYVLITTERPNYPGTYKATDSRLSVVEVATGKTSLIDADHLVTAAGWSPSGSALIYVVDDIEAEVHGIYLTSVPGQAGQELSGIEGNSFNTPTSLQRQFLIWGANNTVLLSRSPDKGVVLVQLGS